MNEPEFKNYLISHGITLEYSNALSFWIRWCNQENVDILLPNYTNIMDFVAYNIEADVSNGTINNRLKAIRKYYVFMVETGRVPPGIIDEINKFKNLATDTKVKNVVDKKEFAGLVGNILVTKWKVRKYRYGDTSIVDKDRLREDREIKACKVRALLFFMFYTGVRIGEVVKMQRQDFELDKNRAIIRTPVKNKSERYVYFPGGDTGITPYIRLYFKLEPGVYNAFNINKTQIRYLVEKINKFLPQGKRITPHVLRHCFGNMLAEGNINVRVAQKLLGHKNIQSTMIYYDPDEKTVEKIYRENIDYIADMTPDKEDEKETK